MNLKRYIRSIKNFPKQGIIFRDITTLIENPKSFEYSINKMIEKSSNYKFDKIAAIEARGFLFASILANKMNKPLVLIRKKGKLPHKTVSKSFKLEYGSDTIEIHKSSIKKKDKILLIDDLIATGGTVNAGVSLLEMVGAKVVLCGFIIDLPELGGSKKLSLKKIDNFSLVSYKGL